MSGSADWEPVSAFHDGHKTYIQFASDSVLPALYNLSPKGKTELINWRYVDSLLIVDRVLKGAVLVYGKEQITLYNPKYFRKRLGRWVSK
jgi:type IV secretory pathway VirB9-like protein